MDVQLECEACEAAVCDTDGNVECDECGAVYAVTVTRLR